MKLRPLHDRVIIKRLDNERKTASGIVIPDNAAEKPDQGEILAVGQVGIAVGFQHPDAAGSSHSVNALHKLHVIVGI